MPIALTNSTIIYRQFYATTASAFIAAINTALVDAGWTSTAVTGGYRLLGTSPQGGQVYLFVRDKGHQYFDNPYYYPQVTFNFQTLDGIYTGADHEVKIRTDWQYQVVAGKCQIFQSVVGVKNQGGGCSFCGGIPYIPGADSAAPGSTAATIIKDWFLYPESVAGICGPFNNGTTIWAFLQDMSTGTGNPICALASTDGGTTWAEVDAANHITSSYIVGSFGSDYFCVQSGTDIYVCYAASAGSHYLKFSVFHMASGGSWGSTFTSTLATGAATNGNALVVACFVGSDLYFVYKAAADQLCWAKYASGSWSASTILPQPGIGDGLKPVGIAVGAGGRKHIFGYCDAGGTGAYGLYHVVLDNTDTLGTEASITGSVLGSGPVNWGYPIYDGTKLILPHVNSGYVAKVATATSVDNPSWTISTVSSNANISSGALEISVIQFGGILYAYMWTDNGAGTDTIFYCTSSDNGATWSSETVIFTDVFNISTGGRARAPRPGIVNGGIGIIIDRLVEGTPPVDPINDPSERWVNFYLAPGGGVALCGGEVPASAPDGSVFWASGDGTGDTGPRGNLIVNGTLGQSEALWGTSYCAPGNVTGSLRLPTLTTAPEIFFGLNLPSPVLWFDGTFITIEPMLTWGLTNSVTPKARAQIWDAMIFSKQLAMDALTTKDGSLWINYTDQYLYGSLNLLMPRIVLSGHTKNYAAIAT